MGYRINISDHGKHVFATDPSTIYDEEHARRVFLLLEKAFPEAQGYKIQTTRYSQVGDVIPYLSRS